MTYGPQRAVTVEDQDDFAKRALKFSSPNNGLFLEQWIYDYGVLDEYAVNAYWTGRYQDCIKACRQILACISHAGGASGSRIS